MKTAKPPISIHIFLQKFSLSLCAVIALLVLVVTAVVLAKDPARLSGSHGPRAQNRTSGGTNPTVPGAPMTPATLDTLADYPHLGRLRTSTCDDPAIPLIVEPRFHYDRNDQALYEELLQKNSRMRSRITAYFARYTKAELQRKGEERIKAELRDVLNSDLVLGQIDRLYFVDYTFLD